MSVSNKALISTKYSNLALKAVEKYIPKEENVLVALKGASKEYLICTDKQLYIIKEGFMTGHTFGQGVFKLPYRNISSVSMDYHLMSGYFEVSSGGVQNTQKSYWANRNTAANPRNSPNSIALVSTVKADFAKATDVINSIIDKIHSPAASPSRDQTVNTKSEVEQIRDLKKLLDEKLITQEEFDQKKKSILDI